MTTPRQVGSAPGAVGGGGGGLLGTRGTASLNLPYVLKERLLNHQGRPMGRSSGRPMGGSSGRLMGSTRGNRHRRDRHTMSWAHDGVQHALGLTLARSSVGRHL